MPTVLVTVTATIRFAILFGKLNAMIEIDAALMHPEPKPINSLDMMQTAKNVYFSKSTDSPNSGKVNPKQTHPIMTVAFLPLLFSKYVITLLDSI